MMIGGLAKMGRGARRVATLDAETDPFVHGRIPKPFIWGLYDGKDFMPFEFTDAVLDYLEDKPWIVYAHNGGRFDYHMPGFLNRIEAFEEVTIINGRLAKFKIGECEFRDSINILPVALRELGCKDTIEYWKMEAEHRQEHIVEIMEYLKQDCIGLHQTITKFHDEYGRGLTLAGSAMKYWQTLSGVKAPRTDKTFYDDMKPFYYGGRVQCFRKGEIRETFYVADINSAYPFAMLSDHPISTVPFKASFSGTFQPQAFYSIAAESRGALPYRDPESGKFLFPNDGVVRLFHATGWEVIAALETDCLHNYYVDYQVTFNEHINFAGYVNHFYLLKQAAEKGTAEYMFAKLFMNSLYGKFGANPEKYKNFQLIPPQFHDAASEDEMSFHGEIGDFLLMGSPLDEMEQRYYNVATAASITGFVRAYLWRNIHATGIDGRMLYCDTDSLAFTGEIPEGMKIGRELGEWDIEAECCYGAIAGKKMYAFQKKPGTFSKPKDEWKTGCKGAKLTADQICRVARGEMVRWENDAPTFSPGKVTKFVGRDIKATA